MKKILVLLLCAFSFVANAQKIVSDNVSSDGKRTIICELINVRSFTDRIVFRVGLSAVVYNGIEQFYLMVETTSATPFRINGGMKLFLKDKNENLTTLSAGDDSDASVRDIHVIGHFVTSDYTTITTYPLSMQNLAQICNNGVVKLRQEHSTGVFDKKFKKDKIGKEMAKEYALIKNAMSKQKSITDF